MLPAAMMQASLQCTHLAPRTRPPVGCLLAAGCPAACVPVGHSSSSSRRCTGVLPALRQPRSALGSSSGTQGCLMAEILPSAPPLVDASPSRPAEPSYEPSAAGCSPACSPQLPGRSPASQRGRWTLPFRSADQFLLGFAGMTGVVMHASALADPPTLMDTSHAEADGNRACMAAWHSFLYTPCLHLSRQKQARRVG